MTNWYDHALDSTFIVSNKKQLKDNSNERVNIQIYL